MSTTTTYPVFTIQELKCILALAEAGAKITDTIGSVHLTDLVAKVSKAVNPVINKVVNPVVNTTDNDWTPRTVLLKYSLINKVGVIKRVREMTGWGLKESLDAVTAGSRDGRNGELTLRKVPQRILNKMVPEEYVNWEIVNDS